jgi:hypothetical protein
MKQGQPEVMGGSVNVVGNYVGTMLAVFWLREGGEAGIDLRW